MGVGRHGERGAGGGPRDQAGGTVAARERVCWQQGHVGRIGAAFRVAAATAGEKRGRPE